MIGGTGLIGGLLAPMLAAAGHEFHILQRRSGGGGAARREHVAPSEEWPQLVSSLAPQAAVSTLGTTMRKAGSEAGFRLVDLDMVLDFARAARAAGAQRMIAVSSVGADAASASFYLRIKAEMEQALAELHFARLDIFRPGLLRGPRAADRRFGERLGIAISPVVNLFLRGSLERFAAIDAAAVAAAIAASMENGSPGFRVHHNRDIRRLARR